MIEGNFEARKIGMRQNKEGVIISFVVQPDDFEAALAMVPIGARVMIGWAQIGDDEKPIENDEIRLDRAVPDSALTVPRPQADKAGTSKLRIREGRFYSCEKAGYEHNLRGPMHRDAGDWKDQYGTRYAEDGTALTGEAWPVVSEVKPKRAFSDLPLSQQCALRCDETGFKQFFQAYFDYGLQAPMTASQVIEKVRSHCGVKSRAELDTNKDAAAKWEELESMYQIYLLDIRYPEGERR